MDITHYGARHFLTLTDCGPSRFSIWKQLARQDLATVFFERGPPDKVLTDNDPAFCSSEFKAFAREWKINLRFRWAYAPAGNRIVERCHRSVKRTAARMHCSIQEAVYWHNVTPKDDESPQTASTNRIHRYKVRVKGFDTPMTSSDPKHSFYQIGDCVWVTAPYSRCTMKFDRGRVTGMISLQLLLVDRIPCHVKDLRTHFCFTAPEKDSDSTSESDNASESGAESAVWQGKCRIRWSTPRGSRSRVPLSALVKKCPSKMTATKLLLLWSGNQDRL